MQDLAISSSSAEVGTAILSDMKCCHTILPSQVPASAFFLGVTLPALALLVGDVDASQNPVNSNPG